MRLSDYSQLLELLPPALAVTLFVYLVHFFGKIIVDQIPYADDRKWSIQLQGTLFMINMMSGGFGIWLALLHPWGVGTWWLHAISFFILSLISGTLFCYVYVESAKVYNHKTKQIQKLNKITDGFFLFYAKTGSYIGIGILPVILFYFGTLEFLSKSIPWMIFNFTMIAMTLIWSAIGYSLRLIKELPSVDVYFVDSNQEPLKNAKLLKISNDVIRVRIRSKILLLNKHQIQRTDVRIPRKSL